MDSFSQRIAETLDHIISSVPGLIPEFMLVGTFVICIFSGLFLDRFWKHSTLTLTLAGIVLSGLAIFNQLQVATPTVLLFGMAVADTLSIYVRLLLAVVSILFILFVQSNHDFRQHKKKIADLYSILLAITIGLHFMVMSTNWLMVFLSIEMVSIGSYILVGYLSKDAKQSEAAMKYVLFGSVCSAVMLYGISLLYGFTGTLDFTVSEHLAGLAEMHPFAVLVALTLVFTGIGFKLSFVPFHFWSPDVYQGAPTPITAFLSTAPKIAAITLLWRILQAWPPTAGFFAENLRLLVFLATIATLIFGNLAALRQTNAKRLMAYSSIGHTGFLMMAVLAYSRGDFSVLLFYLTTYAAMNMGVFMLIDHIESRTGAADITEYKGLGKLMPVAFVSLVVLLVSLTGLPPTAGFIGKLFIFSAVFEQWQLTGNSGMLALLIVGAVTTVISLFFYFKIPLNAFLRSADQAVTPIEPNSYTNLIIAALLSVIILFFGIFPDWLIG